MKQENLIAEKLYQVMHPWRKGRPWVIAKYVRTVEPYVEKYSNISFGSDIKIGPEKTRKVPRTHYFLTVAQGSRIGVTDLKEIRDVTEEAVAEIASIKETIKQREAAVKEAREALRDFCE